MSESIGELIRRAREEAGVSQRSLARRAGTSQAAVSRIERGLEQPSPDRINTLLASLGLRLRFELEPLAEHEAEPRRLIEQSRKSYQERFDEGLAWSDFVREIDDAGKRARGERVDRVIRSAGSVQAVLRQLNANAIDFVVVEGIASIAHGHTLAADQLHVIAAPHTNMQRISSIRSQGCEVTVCPSKRFYRRIQEQAVTVEHEGAPTQIIGLDDLIAMKREAGRDKDLRDIAALTELERQRRQDPA